jgi:hypothetical protein
MEKNDYHSFFASLFSKKDVLSYNYVLERLMSRIPPGMAYRYYVKKIRKLRDDAIAARAENGRRAIATNLIRNYIVSRRVVREGDMLRFLRKGDEG